MMKVLTRLLRSQHFITRANKPLQLLHQRAHNNLSYSNKLVDATSRHLQKVFDDQKYFNDFTKTATKADTLSKPGLNGVRNYSIFNNNSTGLFKNELLSTPSGLIEFSKKSRLEAIEFVDSMLHEVNQNEQGRLTFIRKLDQLSDLLCRVIDVAEFIRASHPSTKWINAAQQTHEIIFEYMNQLNTNVELYHHLRDILDDPVMTAKLTSEEIQVGEYLKQDFERSGIHMDPETRNNFVAITQEISLLGSLFNNELRNLKSFWCEVSRSEFDSIEDETLKQEINGYQQKFSGVHSSSSVQIPLVGHIPYSILSNCANESLRRKIWILLHSSTDEQIETLNGFIKYRAFLARMLGHKSFAHYQLEHKMAKNPENVITFLTNLQNSSRDRGVLDEIKQLYNYKKNPQSTDPIEEIKPWDRDYLVAQLQQDIKLQQQKKEPNPKELEPIHNYFSVGTVVAGLSSLFSHIYNVTFIPEPTLRGETWDQEQVRKIKVYDHTNQRNLGFLYLDFWSPKVLPSHFTIVCLRKLNSSIGTESKEQLQDLVQLDEDKTSQLPIIALVCNFPKASNLSIGRFAGMGGSKEKPTLLTLDQVDIIFHEMGHAMHSMIGKTELHNLSGTRCTTDFVELPSVLMESFSRDPRVLCRIGRHHETGAPLSEELLQQHHHHRVALEECDSYMQSKMAMLDQVLHDENVVAKLESTNFKGELDSTAIYHDLERQLQVFADEWSTWHGKFPHLFSYGAAYYSYLFDRAIADKIWHGLFAEDPWSRKAGEKYKNSILKWGGTRDPWVCLADALNNPELSKGDSHAMEIIGRKL